MYGFWFKDLGFKVWGLVCIGHMSHGLPYPGCRV